MAPTLGDTRPLPPFPTLDGPGPTFSTIPSRRDRIQSIMPPGTSAGRPSVQLHRKVAAHINQYGVPAAGEMVHLGDDYYLEGDQLGGFSLKKIAGNVVKAVAKGAKDTGKAVVKGAKDTGHVAGAVATSKLGQFATAGILAATGVGLIPAAAIGAGVQAGGELTKKGGNLGKAGRGAVRGGAEGAAGSLVGTGARKLLNRGKTPTPSASQVASAIDTANGPLPPSSMIPAITEPLQVAPDLVLPTTPDVTKPAAMTQDEAKKHATYASKAAPAGTKKDKQGRTIVDDAKTAAKVHQAGQDAKKQSQSLADRARRLGGNAASLAKKAQAAADAGDALGAGQLAAAARAAAGLAQNTQDAADQAADYAERAGNAVAAGVDAGAAAAGANSETFGNIVAWVEANPGKAALGGAGVAWLLVKALKGKAA